jgi:hypothetical protein
MAKSAIDKQLGAIESEVKKAKRAGGKHFRIQLGAAKKTNQPTAWLSHVSKKGAIVEKQFKIPVDILDRDTAERFSSIVHNHNVPGVR